MAATRDREKKNQGKSEVITEEFNLGEKKCEENADVLSIGPDLLYMLGMFRQFWFFGVAKG